jgi:hypothetical protein
MEGREEARAWNLSCPDWAERIRTGGSLIPELPLNRAEAEHALESLPLEVLLFLDDCLNGHHRASTVVAAAQQKRHPLWRRAFGKVGCGNPQLP